jgi:peptidoglycan/LPS O-acetylase OafA/YrhL
MALSKNNNFNLIRILAATGVLFSHSFALTSGDSYQEPFRRFPGLSLGHMCVDVFFFSSGYLVLTSLLRRSMLAFIKSRAARIIPGLWVNLLIVALVACAWQSQLPLGSYYRTQELRNYFLWNGTIVFKSFDQLPQVFVNNPFHLVNGSLWTLRYELRMYFVLFFIGLAGFIFKRCRTEFILFSCIGLSLVGFIIASWQVNHAVDGLPGNFARFSFFFFAGGFWAQHGPVPRHWHPILFLIAVLAAIWSTSVFYMVYSVSICFLIPYLAFVPKGRIREFNRCWDVSYGVYIYAFPIQQMLISMNLHLRPLQVFFLVGIVLVPVASLSWILVERPILKWVRTGA